MSVIYVNVNFNLKITIECRSIFYFKKFCSNEIIWEQISTNNYEYLSIYLTLLNKIHIVINNAKLEYWKYLNCKNWGIGNTIDNKSYSHSLKGIYIYRNIFKEAVYIIRKTY